MKRSTPKRRSLSWDDVQVFLCVVQTGSISRAAHMLGVNHSTVLRRIGSLEATLEARLFDRLPSGYVLTAEGNDFSEHLSGVSDQIESAHRFLMGADVEIRGVIRVTAPDTLMSGLLMPLVARFGQLYPKVQMQLIVNAGSSMLSKREADVGVQGGIRPPDALIARPFGAVRTALYGSRQYIEALRQALGREPVHGDYTWVVLDESFALLEQAKWVTRNVSPSKIAVLVSTMGALTDAVASGSGVGLLICPVADLRPELVQLAPADPQFDIKTWILTHPDLKQVARIRAFTQFLFDELTRHSALEH